MKIYRILTCLIAAALIPISVSAGQTQANQKVDYSFRDDYSRHAIPAPAGDDHYWWKGNLHAHTLWSDGDQFPEMVIQWYMKHGYHFLAISDHGIVPQGEKWINPETYRYLESGGGMKVVDLYRERFGDDWVEMREVDESMRRRLERLPGGDGAHLRRPATEDMQIGDTLVRIKPLGEIRHLFEKPGRFLLIQSQEITQGRPHFIHINNANTVEAVSRIIGDDIEASIRETFNAAYAHSRETGQPMLPHLNHPYHRMDLTGGVTAEILASIETVNFFEVYNGAPGSRSFGSNTHPDLDSVWDIALTLRLAEMDLGPLYGLAVDDAHHYGDSDGPVKPGRGWVVVRSRFLTPESLITALRKGEFYASTGVTLSRLESEKDRLHVEINTSGDAEDTEYTIQFIGTRRGYDRSREYRTDDDGNELRNVTKRYSEEIGKVLKEVQGDSATYVFDGDELYVRARIVSSEFHPDPFLFTRGAVRGEGHVVPSRTHDDVMTIPERKKAWIQPVIPGKGLLEAPDYSR